MIQLTPNYYDKFRCIADKCKHNCCIGWEIDIDDETMQYYNSLESTLGDRIRCSVEGEEPHFVLCEGDRCPFLNEHNLCDIISELGEDGLCDICHLHPRFRNFYSNFCETGLGLCCEEAARLILSEKEKFYVKMPEEIELSDEETEFFQIRKEILFVLQDRSKSVLERFSILSQMFELECDYSLCDLCDVYLDLERLDDSWTNELLGLKEFSFDKSIFTDDYFAVYLENIAVYFVFRHLANAMEFGDYANYVKFALVSTYMISAK